MVYKSEDVLDHVNKLCEFAQRASASMGMGWHVDWQHALLSATVSSVLENWICESLSLCGGGLWCRHRLAGSEPGAERILALVVVVI